LMFSYNLLETTYYMLLTLHKSLNQKVVYTPEGVPSITISIKRDDLLHEHISGNKYRKLKYNLEEAKNSGLDTLLTFGGAFSNHIVATAAAGNEFGFKTIGVIRGDELAHDFPNSIANNPSLLFAQEQGMQFKFVDRTTYRLKEQADFINTLKKEFGSFYLVPQGGTNELAVKGCEEILSKEDKEFDYICCAIGTGGTISGIINTALPHQKVLGFPALKGDFLRKDIAQYVVNEDNWTLQEYHFGGFAKMTNELVVFINNFKKQTNIQLDPIYNGKMLFGIVDMIKRGILDREANILAIHTGGLQGIQGMNKRLKSKSSLLIQE